MTPPLGLEPCWQEAPSGSVGPPPGQAGHGTPRAGSQGQRNLGSEGEVAQDALGLRVRHSICPELGPSGASRPPWAASSSVEGFPAGQEGWSPSVPAGSCASTIPPTLLSSLAFSAPVEGAASDSALVFLLHLQWVDSDEVLEYR